MKKHFPKLIAFCLMAASVSVFAQDNGAADKASAKSDTKTRSAKMSKWQQMDVNKDGMISKDEFMKYQEGKWNTMKKNSDGMVDMKDMKDMKKMPKKKARTNGESGMESSD